MSAGLRALDAALEAVHAQTRARGAGAVSFDTLVLSRGLSGLVLAPHPDDFDAIGITLQRLHGQGMHLHIAVCTTGASGVEPGYAGAQTDEARAALREQEQLASCAFFGLPAAQLAFLRLPNDAGGNPRLDAANHATIQRLLVEHQPHCVFLPHGNDSNVTHQRIYALIDAVARQMHYPLWAWLNQDAKTLAMHHDLYTPFDEDAARWKAELLRFHASQQQRNLNTRGHGFDARVLRINQQSAAAVQAAQPYAEVFELQRLG
ncbi:MAG: PIG-L family deacetylase [Hylemonella sp.]|uniref:PIG-L deacetylase family protein n=1 Tax=Hylemonella sp. TaxID=2066020 RepID=UPI0022C8571E|nr:PIG-L family deacetylase [Hylemonella sp.]MCZ8253291.1 PIG-L family deacetylase [Hylemonella sp.]